MFVRSRVCCHKWHLTIRLDANAVHVSSCRARGTLCVGSHMELEIQVVYKA